MCDIFWLIIEISHSAYFSSKLWLFLLSLTSTSLQIWTLFTTVHVFFNSSHRVLNLNIYVKLVLVYLVMLFSLLYSFLEILSQTIFQFHPFTYQIQMSCSSYFLLQLSFSSPLHSSTYVYKEYFQGPILQFSYINLTSSFSLHLVPWGPTLISHCLYY